MGRDSGHAHHGDERRVDVHSVDVRSGTVTERDRRYGTSASLVASDIGENIISGHLPPGSSLRVHELASQYEMSLTPVREAMQRLVTEGLVARRPGVGFAVAPLTGDDIRDVFLTLGFVSGELAARAMDALTDAQRTELRALHHESIAMLHRDAANGLDSRNRAFYSLINHASRSPKLRWTAGLCIRFVPRTLYSDIPGWPEITVDGQRKVLEALDAGDVRAVREATRDFHHRAGEALAENFSENLRVRSAV